MAIETWRVLVGVAVVLVTFAVVVTLAGDGLSLPLAIAGLIVSVLTASFSYLLIKRGYAIGQRAGEEMREKS